MVLQQSVLQFIRVFYAGSACHNLAGFLLGWRLCTRGSFQGCKQGRRGPEKDGLGCYVRSMLQLRLKKLLPRAHHHGYSAIWTLYKSDGEFVGVWVLRHPGAYGTGWRVIMGSGELPLGMKVSRALGEQKFRTRTEAVEAVYGVLAGMG